MSCPTKRTTALSTHGKSNAAGVVERRIKRGTAISQLRLPKGQEDNIDHVSCGTWLKVRTDHPRETGRTTTAFVSIKDKGLHQLVPFSYIRQPLEETQI